MSSIDIKNKCPKGENGGHRTEECARYSRLIASLRNLDGNKPPHYRVCKHTGDRIVSVTNLKYGEKELTDEKYDPLSTKHQPITEVSTYYSATYDGSQNSIEKPLLLKIKDDKEYHWYENKGDPLNTKWENIPDGEKLFYDGYNLKGDALKKRLNDLTCRIHNFHSVNIYEKGDDGKYSCPACGKYEVTVSSETKTDISGYTKHKHTYDADTNLVRYDATVLEWKDGDNYKPIPLNDRYDNSLGVYYWDKDEECKRPLLMEIGLFGEIPVSLGNNGEKGNSKWTMIMPEGDELQLKGNELQKILHQQKCKLFRPAVINVSVKGESYLNDYCNGKNCKNGDCTHTIQVKDYGGSLYEEFSLEKYTALKHTYGGPEETFTITGFTNGPSPIDIPTGSFPIWDVREVVVFFPECKNSPDDKATTTPLLIYVNSNNKNAKKWYKNSGPKGGNNWVEVEGELEDKPPNEVRDLEGVIDEIKELKLYCQNEGILQPPHILAAKSAFKSEVVKDTEAEPRIPGEKLLTTLTKALVELRLDAEQIVEDLVEETIGFAKVLKDALPLARKLFDLPPEKTPSVPTAPASEPYLDSADTSAGLESNTGVPQVQAVVLPVVRASVRDSSESEEVEAEVIELESEGQLLAGEEVPPLEVTEFEIIAAAFPGTVDGKIIEEVEVIEPVGITGEVVQEIGNTITPVIVDVPITITDSTSPQLDGSPPIADLLPITTPSWSPTTVIIDLPGPETAKLEVSGPSVTGNSNSNTPNIIKTTISVSTGILGTSALACFAGWKLYNRYKGDPWVRQI
ncbi:hypothetical protein BEWA_045560 [Theileria equi strain WA]|uniref:Uncharacterized protein n=1 Tax=Theileria equi strain WA TaxID=1537102 RepID=L1L9J6_THEEQ|nr:hypothetical protein BEWA_045560 [Theileria equi strain WA]EKX72092.1 hypothetical protein BEWA_045560 [Theileria equi strain WA]|eukprot:XP_004831544.1 hypothetical protein BEWA_045560 [Theileria equi strain WA]